MPRRPRIVIPGFPHHITQRGNYKQIVFREVEDFERYCYWVNKYAALYGLEILAYCLMSNHIHFIAVPHHSNSLALTFKTAHMRYAQHANTKEARKGHLWQGRFFSCVLQDDHLYRAIRYVEQNPVKGRVVKEAWDYRWSSARWHMGLDLKSAINLKKIAIADNWEKYLKENDSDFQGEIKIKTRQGLIMGEEGFITSLEKRLGKSLKCLPKGRPKMGKMGTEKWGQTPTSEARNRGLSPF